MSNSKYQEALDRLCKNDYFDEKGNCNCELIVMDRILLQELVDKAAPKKPFYEADGYDENGELIYDKLPKDWKIIKDATTNPKGYK